MKHTFSFRESVCLLCVDHQAIKFHPLKVMFWDCFSFYGPGPFVPVIGMMNSDQYIDVLSTHMITELERVCLSGEGIFQQDLAPCHNSKKVKKFFEQNEIRLLQWPGNSPDINPIENLWAICKTKYLRWISLRKAISLLP